MSADRFAPYDPAKDEALFRAVDRGGPPVRRCFRCSPCVVVGRHQRVEREVDLATCRRFGTPILRRFTGGGTVYLDEGCLLFSVCGPRRTLGFSYADYAGWMVDLASAFGLVACVTGNRVDIAGRKISGMAARVSPRTVFVHGTLLVSTDLERLRTHLEVGEEQTRRLPKPQGNHVRSDPRPVTTLSAQAGRRIAMEEIFGQLGSFSGLAVE